MADFSQLSKTKLSELAKLKQKKFRNQNKLLVLEGERLISQLAQYHVFPIELLATSSVLVPDFAVPGYICSEAELKRICDTESPAGIAGIYAVPQPGKPDLSRALYLEDISNPGNLGTIFRTAAAFAISSILLSPQSCEVGNPKVIRASMGAVYKVPWTYVSREELQKTDARKIAVDMNGKRDLPNYQKIGSQEIYILGNEAHGISTELMAIADASIRIPMPGRMESLNLAISTAILCYQLSLTP